MSNHKASRLEIELDLLEAMYPAQIHYDTPSRQLKFLYGASALHLRLPESYPDAGLPDVISATNASKTDLRVQTRDVVKELGLVEGEEVLDAVIAAFQQILETKVDCAAPSQGECEQNTELPRAGQGQVRTVIIWLHHLLNTHKRKLALSPPPSSPPVSGITKPGYPGILIYSGPSVAVLEHVHALKAQNWQAFQVRYEGDELWVLTHGEGVKEVESMSDVVKAIEGTVEQKAEFLKAVGIK